MRVLQEIIDNLLRSRGMWEGYQVVKLIQSWGITVGEPLSMVTRAQDFNRGRLRVLVQDPVWGHHLSLMKPQIIEKINIGLKNNLVKDIYFQVGEIYEDCNQEMQLMADRLDRDGNIGAEASGFEFKRNIERLKNMLL